MNKILTTCFLTGLLAVQSVALSHAGQPDPYSRWGCTCPLERSASGGQPRQAKLVMAIIYKIDHQQGVIELDSELGILQAHAAPSELTNLHVGEKVLVQVAAEASSHPRRPSPSS